MRTMEKPKPPGAGAWIAALAIGAFSAGLRAQTTRPATAPAAANAQLAPGDGAEGTFDLHVREQDIRGVLQLLSTQGKRNVVATKEVTGTVTFDLYGVTFKEALDAVLRSSGYVYEEKGGFIYVYTPEQLKEIKNAERKMIVKVFRLYYITAKDAETLIRPILSADGTAALTPAAIVGITTSSTDAGGNNLGSEDVIVVRDYEENVRRVSEILKKLDVRPDQVLIEATILRATLTEGNDLGVDFNALSGIDFEGMNSTTAGLTNLTPEAATAVDGSRDLGLRTDFVAGVPTGGMTIGLITNNVSLFIRALESVTDVTVLANPKLLVINKQRGEVMIGNRDGYLTTTITETTATETVEFLETGTRLVVRPYIGDNEYVRLEIHPEDSSGSVATVGTAALPSETTTEVTTNVFVRSGRTIVIGGLFRERTSNGRSQVPVLGNIPYLGVMFRSTSDDTDREEVIILVTPHILKQDADEAASEQIKDDVERFRIGQRKGLRWWGRSRLAQTHMRWARRELASGRPDKALWNIDMALSLAPRMEEAIRLKERLTERAYWADEARMSSIKYAIRKMIMHELGKPLERIIPPDKPRDAQDVDEDVRKALGIQQRFEDPLPQVRPLVGRNVKGQPGPGRRDPAADETTGTDKAGDKPSEPGK